MFAAGVSRAFVVPLGAAGYVGPVSAQRMLLRGFGVDISGEPGGVSVRVGSRVLVGPAGKVFAFGSENSAVVWLSINGQLAVREKRYFDDMPESARAAWLAKKRAQLDRIAGVVVSAASRQKVTGIAAALIAESDFCLKKWD